MATSGFALSDNPCPGDRLQRAATVNIVRVGASLQRWDIEPGSRDDFIDADRSRPNAHRPIQGKGAV
jgi:hypothetical protein